jgi:hypothetical protein
MPNTQKCKTIKVNPKHVGSIIGQQGVTIKGLAKSAGKGCRIQHLREEKGSFVITAWDNSTILRAEIKIKEYVKILDKKQPQVSKKRQYTSPAYPTYPTYPVYETQRFTNKEVDEDEDEDDKLPWSQWILTLDRVGNWEDEV